MNRMTLACVVGILSATVTMAADTVKKTVDMKPVDGRYKGHTLLGIYSLDGGKLRIAFAEPGTDRPTQHESCPGNGVVVAVMRRARE